MEISDVLSLDCTACAIQISSKKKVLESIARVAHQKAQYLDINTVLSSIFDREKKGSTGIMAKAWWYPCSGVEGLLPHLSAVKVHYRRFAKYLATQNAK